MPLVELARYYNRAEISIAQSVLTNADIESFVFDRETAIAFVPARLMVLDEDEAEARRLLRATP